MHGQSDCNLVTVELHLLFLLLYPAAENHLIESVGVESVCAVLRAQPIPIVARSFLLGYAWPASKSTNYLVDTVTNISG